MQIAEGTKKIYKPLDSELDFLSNTRFPGVRLAPLCIAVPKDIPPIQVTPITPYLPNVPRNPVHYHDCFELMWFMDVPKGCIHELNGKVFEQHNGELHIILPVHPHRILSTPGTVCGKKLNFTWDILTHIAKPEQLRNVFSLTHLLSWANSGNAARQIIQVPQDMHSDIESSLDTITHLCNKLREFIYTLDAPEIKSLSARIMQEFSAFIGILSRLYDRVVTDREREVCDKYAAPLAAVIDHIYKNYAAPITLDTLCDIAGFKVSWFSRIFREIFNMPMMDYVNFVRIFKARELLCGTIMSIGDIGIECGFNSTIYFDRVFKLHTGCSPKVFRNEYEYMLEHMK